MAFAPQSLTHATSSPSTCISFTYALTDPVMTVFRPIAGVATAIAAGLATNLFGVPRPRPGGTPLPPQGADFPLSSQAIEGDFDNHDHGHAADLQSKTNAGAPGGTAAIDVARRVIR